VHLLVHVLAFGTNCVRHLSGQIAPKLAHIPIARTGKIQQSTALHAIQSAHRKEKHHQNLHSSEREGGWIEQIVYLRCDRRWCRPERRPRCLLRCGEESRTVAVSTACPLGWETAAAKLVDWTGGLLLHGPRELGWYRTSSVSWVEPERSVARGLWLLFVCFRQPVWGANSALCLVLVRARGLGDPSAPDGAMELPEALSRAPTRPQARAVEGACPESRHHAEADTGPPPPRSPAFYSSVFAQVRQPLDGMPAPTGATRESFFAFRFSICDVCACRSKR
jgi:hypothetical protein